MRDQAELSGMTWDGFNVTHYGYTYLPSRLTPNVWSDTGQKPSSSDLVGEATDRERSGVNRVSPADRIIDEAAAALATNELGEFFAFDFELTKRPVVRVPGIRFHLR